MIKEIWGTWPFIFAGIAVLMRVVMEKMIKVSDARKQFIWVGVLFGLYTVLLLAVVCITYEMLSTGGGGMEKYHEQVVFLILVMGAVMLFAGALCYIRMGKRRLSDADKMKLRDM